MCAIGSSGAHLGGAIDQIQFDDLTAVTAYGKDGIGRRLINHQVVDTDCAIIILIIRIATAAGVGSTRGIAGKEDIASAIILNGASSLISSVIGITRDQFKRFSAFVDIVLLHRDANQQGTATGNSRQTASGVSLPGAIKVFQCG